MEHNGERMERSDESDARKRDTPRGVGATRPCVAAADTTGMPERRKGVDVVRPHRRYGNSPSRMARPKKKMQEAAPSAKGMRNVDEGMTNLRRGRKSEKRI